MDALEKTRRDVTYMKIVSEDMLKVESLSSFSFIVWGTATLLAVGITYILINVGLGSYTRFAWIVSMYGALALSIAYLRTRSFGLSPLSTRILNHVWWSVTASAFFLSFVLGAPIHLDHGWSIYFVLVQILIAIAVFITGGIYLLPTLRNVGIIQWLGALATATFVPPVWVPLEFGIFVGGGLLIGAFITRMSSIKPTPADDEALA